MEPEAVQVGQGAARRIRSPQEAVFVDDVLLALRSPNRAVLIAGAGLMGVPYALPFLVNSQKTVILFDTSPARCALVHPRLEGYLQDWRDASLTRLNASVLRGRVITAGSYADVRTHAGSIGLCIEAITESLAEKELFFSTIGEILPDDVSIATNTSGLDIARLCAAFHCPSSPGQHQRDGIFLAAHASNPPHLFPLVELTGTEDTFAPVLEAWHNYLKELGWQPVTLKRFSPGYIMNALQFEAINSACLLLDDHVVAVPAEIDACIRFLAAGYWRQGGFEAADGLRDWDVPTGLEPCAVHRLQACLSARANWLVKQGICSRQDINAYMRRGLGVRWEAVGLLRGADLGKIGLFADIHAELMQQFDVERVSPRLRTMVAAGRFGVDPGRGSMDGFYHWTSDELERCQAVLKRLLVDGRRMTTQV